MTTTSTPTTPDAIVFTAGAGEGSTRVRADALRGLERLGIELDPADFLG